MVTKVNEKEFLEILNSNEIVVADFYAIWCGPCKMMHPIFEDLAKKYIKIKFLQVNIDDNNDLALKQNVQYVPTFIGYKNGKELNRIVGYNTKEDFEYFLQTL